MNVAVDLVLVVLVSLIFWSTFVQEWRDRRIEDQEREARRLEMLKRMWEQHPPQARR